MNKQEYIIKQIAKTNKKNFENYIVNRLFHRLDNIEVKFITQQYISLNNRYYLTDIYLPQLQMHIEVDEPFHQKQLQSDIDRETDIINATNDEFFRIKVTSNLIELNLKIENLIQTIQNKIEMKKKINDWEPWDIENEFHPEFYKNKGYLDVSENPAFRRIVDVCNCLGQNFKGAQQAWYKSKVYSDYFIWCPKFYINEEWDNNISMDGEVITEKCKIPEKFDKWFQETMATDVKRIVFPRRIDNLGSTLYRFAGIFETDFANSSFENGIVHKRTATRFVL